MFVIKDWRRQESEMSCLTPSGHICLHICCVVHVAKVAGFLLHSPCRSHVINKGFNRQTSGSGGLLANLELMATLCNRRTAENHQRSQTGRYVLANCFFFVVFFFTLHLVFWFLVKTTSEATLVVQLIVCGEGKSCGS